MVRLCGAALGLLAFAATIVLGVLADNSFEITLLRAVRALVIFCVLGVGVGWVARRVLDEHALRRHRELFAEPGADDGTAVATDATDEQDGSSAEAGDHERSEAAQVAAER